MHKHKLNKKYGICSCNHKPADLGPKTIAVKKLPDKKSKLTAWTKV